MRNADASLSEENDPAFIGDATDEYYASDNLGYLHDLLFDLTDSKPYCHTRHWFDQPKLCLPGNLWESVSWWQRQLPSSKSFSYSAYLILPVWIITDLKVLCANRDHKNYPRLNWSKFRKHNRDTSRGVNIAGFAPDVGFASVISIMYLCSLHSFSKPLSLNPRADAGHQDFCPCPARLGVYLPLT